MKLPMRFLGSENPNQTANLLNTGNTRSTAAVRGKRCFALANEFWVRSMSHRILRAIMI